MPCADAEYYKKFPIITKRSKIIWKISFEQLHTKTTHFATVVCNVSW